MGRDVLLLVCLPFVAFGMAHLSAFVGARLGAVYLWLQRDIARLQALKRNRSCE